VVCLSVGPSVCLSRSAEPIDMLFGIWTRVGPRNHALNAGAHWRHLANTTGLSVWGGDAALYQITLTTVASSVHGIWDMLYAA